MTTVTFTPEFESAVNALDAASGPALGARLAEMVRLRVSHINGCHYCIKLHSTALKREGVEPRVIDALRDPALWASDGVFSAPELAALRWAEVLTDAPRGVESEARAALGEHFTDAEASALAEHVLMINLWNRYTRATE